jgi:hypothetical protein
MIFATLSAWNAILVSFYFFHYEAFNDIINFNIIKVFDS